MTDLLKFSIWSLVGWCMKTCSFIKRLMRDRMRLRLVFIRGYLRVVFILDVSWGQSFLGGHMRVVFHQGPHEGSLSLGFIWGWSFIRDHMRVIISWRKMRVAFDQRLHNVMIRRRIIMYSFDSFMHYFSKLEHIAHDEAKNQCAVKTKNGSMRRKV